MTADTLVPLCSHCGERVSGAEGTIWCADCLEWWREQYRADLRVRQMPEVNA